MHYYYNFVVVLSGYLEKIVLHQTCILAVTFMSALLTMVRCMDFGCFAFERYNGILGAMPNNNRNIEPQLMQRFLRDNLSLTFASFEDDEISQELRLLLPKLTHTGSLADTVSSIIHTSTRRGWTIDSIDCTLPKFSTHCTWTAVQMDYAKELYVALYSVPVECIDIPQTCYSYTATVTRL